MELQKEVKNIFFFIIIFAIFSPLVSHCYDEHSVYSSTDIKEDYCTLNVSPLQINISVLIGSSNCSYFSVYAGDDGNYLNVNLTTADYRNWTVVNKTYLELLPAKTYNVSFNITVWEVPSPKTHNSLIYINSTDGQSKHVNITTTVVGVGRINLTVNDTSGNKIGNASVFIWCPGSNYSGFTDSQGNFLSGWLPENNYTINVSKDCYGNESMYVEVCNESTFDFHITLSPEFPPYFTNIFPITGSYTHRSDNNPTPTQNVDFWVYVSDDDNTPDELTVMFYYSTDNKQTWLSKEMSYDNMTDTWNTQLGNYAPQTAVYYYVTATDNITIVRTPVIGYDYLVWDNPPIPPSSSTSSGGSDEGGSSSSGGVLPRPETDDILRIEIIKYPLEIKATQGDSKLFSVTVKNTGNITLKNIRLYIGGLFPTKISPVEIEEMEPGSRKLYLVEINVSEDTEPGNYTLLLKAISDETSADKTTTLIVLKKADKPQEKLTNEELRRALDELKQMIDIVWDEAVRTGLKGKNVTKVFEILKETKESYALAEVYFGEKDYDRTWTQIGKTKKLLEEAVKELSRLKFPKLICPIINHSFLSICVLWWILILVLLAITFVLFFEREKFRSLLRAMRKTEEWRRIKERIRERTKRDSPGRMSIHDMIKEYHYILRKMKEKEKKGEDVRLIKMRTETLLDEIKLLKNSGEKRRENMKKKLRRMKELLSD